jgi:hypothetical protein
VIPPEWRQRWSEVTDAMRQHTLPFVSPLSACNGTHMKLVGTGSYVSRKCRKAAARDRLQGVGFTRWRTSAN